MCSFCVIHVPFFDLTLTNKKLVLCTPIDYSKVQVKRQSYNQNMNYFSSQEEATFFIEG